MAGGQVTAPCTRDDPPDADDFGLCVRIVSGGPTPIVVTFEKATTSVVTSVAGSLVNVTLLAVNATRLGATFYNDSNSRLFLKLGAAATTASFTVRIGSQDYYEVPFSYTGIIDGIWTPVASGFVVITELTP